MEPDHSSHTQNMVAQRGHIISGKRSHPYVKKSFKTQHGRIPIDPAILSAIGHRFIAQKKQKTKNAGMRVWGNASREQKQENFLGSLIPDKKDPNEMFQTKRLGIPPFPNKMLPAPCEL